MARPGATHRAAAPSCTPATRDRTGRLHRDVHGRPAACRNPGLLDDSGLASASRPRIARGPQAPGRQPGHPGARSSSPAASGRPGRAPVHPLRRDPRSAPPPGGRSPCGRHDGRGRQRTTAIQEDPVGGMRVRPMGAAEAVNWSSSVVGSPTVAGTSQPGGKGWVRLSPRGVQESQEVDPAQPPVQVPSAVDVGMAGNVSPWPGSRLARLGAIWNWARRKLPGWAWRG